MKKIVILASILFISISSLFAVTADEKTGVDRYAIYVGANYGGKSRERLLYAGSDAQSFKKTMSEIGGVTESNSKILIDPTKDQLDQALKQISSSISSKSGVAKRSEFIFYYSGHSDEDALLLGDTKYTYSSLKAAITDVPSDIHVVILDSCYSGNFIRTKGGQKRKPFLVDDSSVVTGHAYLSSSSDNESSQESDEIESSFFTNAMITGLRGAADTSGDNKVTLNELYSYAFNDTLSKTENTKVGPQHPNYNITLVGSGDLILSDLTTSEAMLSISKDAKGKFIIRDSNDKLISEINKIEGQPIFMALPAGQYTALIIDEYSTKQGTFLLNKDQIYVMDQNSFSTIARKSNRLRGGEESSESEADKEKFDTDNTDVLDLDGLDQPSRPARPSRPGSENLGSEKTVITILGDEDAPQEKNVELENAAKSLLFDLDFGNDFQFGLSLVPGVQIVNPFQHDLNIQLGIFGTSASNIKGFQFSDFINIATQKLIGFQISGLANMEFGQMRGAQMAGLFNISNAILGAQFSGLFNISQNIIGMQAAGNFNITKNINGLQAAGIFDFAKNVNGAQISGIFNSAEKIKGLQLGLVNYANEIDGIQIGLINFAGNGLADLSIAWTTNDLLDFEFKGGAKYFYTIYGASIKRNQLFDVKDYNAVHAGFGTRAQFDWFSIDTEAVLRVNFSSEESFTMALKNIKPEKRFSAVTIPTLRINFNFFEGNYSSLFAGIQFEYFRNNENNLAFSLMDRRWKWGDNQDAIYPSFRFGISQRLIKRN